MYEIVTAEPPLYVWPEAPPVPELLKVTEFATEPAWPVIEPLIGFVKVCVPPQVFESESKVDEANVQVDVEKE